MANALGALVVLLVLLAAPVHADVFRPAYLQLQQLDLESYRPAAHLLPAPWRAVRHRCRRDCCQARDVDRLVDR